MIIVFANLVNLAVPNSLPLLFERITIVFYFLEMVSQTISRGFIDGSYSYLKNPWMCLDFILTLCSLPDLEMNLNKTFGVQALRGIRALQLISRFPGVQTMAEGILLSIKRMLGAALIMFLFLIAITLTAKQNVL
ncbi:sodium channel protein 1 brain-like [Stegodyphus dumicola]|uniref:sodium channel protein 1 brain-like n=1 Tax=Stegodyphus dumicola TaxID=202533 RepID=UPI0015B329E1|nr:sodium channel protein 1 brain-like [Stegodyphus dumicola]